MDREEFYRLKKVGWNRRLNQSTANITQVKGNKQKEAQGKEQEAKAKAKTHGSDKENEGGTKDLLANEDDQDVIF